MCQLVGFFYILKLTNHYNLIDTLMSQLLLFSSWKKKTILLIKKFESILNRHFIFHFLNDILFRKEKASKKKKQQEKLINTF